MARAKEFEAKTALAAAMKVFWRLGFENTSLETLIRETGVAKQSLYDTFGDKRALYLKALAYYREETNSLMRRQLKSAPTAKKGFTDLFAGLIAESREQHERGCLLLSANMERAADDTEIIRFLQDNQAEVELIFAETVKRARSVNEACSKTEAVALGPVSPRDRCVFPAREST